MPLVSFTKTFGLDPEKQVTLTLPSSPRNWVSTRHFFWGLNQCCQVENVPWRAGGAPRNGKKAVGKGYNILSLHEVWHFPQSKVRLLADYANTRLKLKTEASGWPSYCDNEEKKEQYVREFRQHGYVSMRPWNVWIIASCILTPPQSSTYTDLTNPILFWATITATLGMNMGLANSFCLGGPKNYS